MSEIQPSDSTEAEAPVLLTGEHFMKGDVACAEGAIAAGCRFFAGYPITPASEIAERISERFPGLPGAQYVQMEDEIASMAAIVGGSNAGVKSLTATSGPGVSLMNENIGLAAITETPCVVVNVQRGGPSTGMPTLPAQGDVMQAKWGSQGDYPMITYAPGSPQEMFDLTIEAFNVAERYRTPVIVLADQTVGHMSGKVTIPESVETVERLRPDDEIDPSEFLPYDAGTQVPPMAAAGDGARVHVTGLTHDERGYPDIDPETQERMISRLMGKIEDNRTDICDLQRYRLDDADVASVEYGVNEPRFPDFKRKRWAESEWDLTVYDSADLDLPASELGLEGSFTEVTTLESIGGPERRREWLEGDPDEQAADIASVLEDRL